MKLIELEKVLALAKDLVVPTKDGEYRHRCIDPDAVRELPSVLQIVRCKDCVHHEDEEPGTVWCHNMVGSWVPEDWFCADGERRAE